MELTGSEVLSSYILQKSVTYRPFTRCVEKVCAQVCMHALPKRTCTDNRSSFKLWLILGILFRCEYAQENGTTSERQTQSSPRALKRKTYQKNCWAALQKWLSDQEPQLICWRNSSTIGQLITFCNPNSGASNALFWSPWAPGTHVVHKTVM